MRENRHSHRGSSKPNRAERSPVYRRVVSSASEDSSNDEFESDTEDQVPQSNSNNDVPVDMGSLSITITPDQKEAYHNRIEMMYNSLPDLLTKPEPTVDNTASMARGQVVVAAKLDSLPTSNFIPAKFKAYRDKYMRAIKLVDTKTTDENGKEITKKVKVLSSKKVKLGLEDDVFHPKWLYNVDKPQWPQCMEMDDEIYDVLPEKTQPADKFKVSKKEVNNIQHACAIALNASNHADWMLTTVKKKVDDCFDPNIDAKATLEDIKDLVLGLSWANEFMAGQFIYLHGGFTHMMRKENIKLMEGLKEPDERELIQQPFNVGALFNGHISTIQEKINARQTSKAMKNLGNVESVVEDKGQKSKPPKARYNKSSSKVSKQQQYGDFDRHGKRIQNNQQKSGWQNTQRDPPANFLFNKGNKGRKPKKQFKKRNDSKWDSKNYR